MKGERPLVVLVNPAPESNPFSLGYIASYLRKNGYDAHLLDFGAQRYSLHDLRTLMTSRQLALIGISAYQSAMGAVLAFARLCRQFTQTPIVLGGPQIALMPDAALSELEDMTFLARGEGELVCLELLRALESGADLASIRGLCWKAESGQVRTNPGFPTMADLDQYPSPYLDGTLRVCPGGQAVLLTSRGCPYRCSFCVTPQIAGQQLRVHSVERVLEEISYLRSRGVGRFWIADPLFAASKSRVVAIMEGIVSRHSDCKLWFETRANLIEPEMLDLFRRAGVVRLGLGLESANQAVLDAANKDQDIQEFTGKVVAIRSAGIGVELLHIYGLPGDTRNSILETFDYVRQAGLMLEGNSRGNRHQLYFGSEYARDPQHYDLVVNDIARRPDYPAYLSPGSLCRPATLSEADLEIVESRQNNETALAEFLSRFCHYRERYGFSFDDFLGLHWRRTEKLHQHLIRSEEQLQFGEHESAESTAIPRISEAFFVDACPDFEATPWLKGLQNHEAHLRFDSALHFLLLNDSSLRKKELLSWIRKRARTTFFSEATRVTFTLLARHWRWHREEIIADLQLMLTPPPVPGYWTLHDPSRAQRSFWPSCRPLILVPTQPGETLLTPSEFSDLQRSVREAHPSCVVTFLLTLPKGISDDLVLRALRNPVLGGAPLVMLGDCESYATVRRCCARESALPPVHCWGRSTLYRGTTLAEESALSPRHLFLSGAFHALLHFDDLMAHTGGGETVERSGPVEAIVPVTPHLQDTHSPRMEPTSSSGRSAVEPMTRDRQAQKNNAVRLTKNPRLAYAELDDRLFCRSGATLRWWSSAWKEVLLFIFSNSPTMDELLDAVDGPAEQLMLQIERWLETGILEIVHDDRLTRQPTSRCMFISS